MAVPAGPRVSVVIPTFNRLHVLPQAIDSVQQQTMSDLELLVVDDGSDDGTGDFVQSLDDPRVRYVRIESRSGAPAARNAGIRAARGSFHALLDSDDEWLPCKLERQLECMDRVEADRPDVVTTKVFWNELPTEVRPAHGELQRIQFLDLLAFDAGGWGGQTILVRRTPRTLQVEFDEDLRAGQDWDYVLRLTRLTRVACLLEPLVRVHRASGDHIGTLASKLAGRLQIRRKYDADLRRHPRALVHHEVGLGLLRTYTGSPGAARDHFRRALRGGHRRPSVVMLWLASFFGATATRRVAARVPPLGTRVG